MLRSLWAKIRGGQIKPLEKVTIPDGTYALVTLIEDLAAAPVQHLQVPIHEVCSCPPAIPMVLNPEVISFYRREQPFMCLQCHRPVHLANLRLHPVQLETIFEDMDAWVHMYKAIVQLQENEYERWAEDQLSDIESPISQRGLALCDDLENKRKCYYNFSSRHEDRAICPKCTQALSVETLDTATAPLFCKRCNIAMNLSLLLE